MVNVIDSDIERPELTAAIDETLLEARLAERIPDTIHLYRRRPASVSIGYFQAARDVAEVDACRRDGIPVVRRVSGGGAIFTDHRQLVYAIVLRPSRPIPAREGFVLACGAVVRALVRLGVEGARMSGVNDVLVGDGKVSGSAQAIRRGVHLIHGTVLVDANLDTMFRYLRPHPTKVKSQGFDRPQDRVTTLAKAMGSPPAMEEVKAAVTRELASMSPGDMEETELGEREVDMALRLMDTRYSKDEWNLRR
jgi:lipoate-protein ligase A